MKIRILSDLHLEFRGWMPPAIDCDVVVLAGDIHIGAEGLGWAREHFRDVPIVYVPGNHEFYGGQMQEVLASLRERAGQLDIHMLDGDEAIIDHTRFLGGTLWSDFALCGAQPSEVERAMGVAKRAMNDFRIIDFGEAGRFEPHQAREIHLAQRAWLKKKLHEPFHGQTIVVTHYLPHPLSIHPRYEDSPLNPAFASDLTDLIKSPVSLWIHGHTHDSCDYTVNGTRVVCNPRGYLPMEPNPTFKPSLVIEL